MRLYYIANARMPSEKAHGIQIAKMCESFIDQGADLVLVLPSRGRAKQTIKDFYGLRHDIPTVRLPSLDILHRGRAGYYLGTISFILSYSIYLLTHLKRGDVVYTVDLDHFAYCAIPWVSKTFFCEMHGGKPDTFIHRALFKAAAGIIPTNSITKEQLKKTFSIPDEKFIVEPNGVDFSKFAPIDRALARQKLGLDPDMTLALYVGRFFDWKGLEILSEAAKMLPPDMTLGIVGGEARDFSRVTGESADGLVFYGDKPYTQMPLWAAAANVLLVLGTKRDEQSWQYTSPMKVFEYMAMKRPIVASRTPALQNILSEEECYFYEPDSAPSLVAVMREAAAGQSRAERARQKVEQFSWDLRGKRILAFINAHTKK